MSDDDYSVTCSQIALTELSDLLEQFMRRIAGDTNVKVVREDAKSVFWGVDYGDTGFSISMNITE